MAEFELEEVRVYLRLAEEKLVVARDLVNLGHYRDTVAKAYYAMFYAAKAALLTVGVGEVRKVVAEAVGSEGEKNGRESV
ncbi:MAG TPA: HEPN domain-containing protein [Anaerolineae bacterium]|nr:HEPN domain-containing protein [Anaerolineae bacterium]